VNAYYDGAEWLNASETTTPPVDTVAPVISGTAASAITSTGANATWITNETSTSQVEYGTAITYGSTTTLDATMVTSHSVVLAGLTANTTYHYRVISKDAAGNTATSGDFTFITTGSTTTPKPGDVNGDSLVDALDLSTVLTNWNLTGRTRAQGDVTGDGTVDALDLSTISSNWSK
jgi:hypothetical protein